MTKPKDPVADLANGLAADHAAEKNKKAPKAAAPAQDDPDAPTSTGDGNFIGDFDSFEAVREYANGEGFNIEAGDMTVINGSLCRYTGKVFEVVVDLLTEYAAPADHIESFNRSLNSIERVVLGAKFESGSLMANVRDVVIDLFKNRPKAWTEMSNAEQRDLVKKIEASATDLVRKVARVIAEGEEISIVGKLERYTHSGSFDLKISSPAEEEAAIQLFRMQGHDIVIVSADAKRFIDGMPDAVTDADEPELFPSAAETIIEQREPEAPPADDSDLAGDEVDTSDETVAETEDAVDTEEETNVVPIAKADEVKPVSLVDQLRAPSFGNGKIGSDDDGVGEYESRENPEDVAERETAPTATYVTSTKPSSTTPGETWYNPEDEKLRHLHTNMKWYMQAPTEEALAKWRAENEKDEGGFDDEAID